MQTAGVRSSFQNTRRAVVGSGRRGGPGHGQAGQALASWWRDEPGRGSPGPRLAAVAPGSRTSGCQGAGSGAPALLATPPDAPLATPLPSPAVGAHRPGYAHSSALREKPATSGLAALRGGLARPPGPPAPAVPARPPGRVPFPAPRGPRADDWFAAPCALEGRKRSRGPRPSTPSRRPLPQAPGPELPAQLQLWLKKRFCAKIALLFLIMKTAGN